MARPRRGFSVEKHRITMRPWIYQKLKTFAQQRGVPLCLAFEKIMANANVEGYEPGVEPPDPDEYPLF